MSKKVFVTGGLGFIGRQTLSLLKEREFEIYVATRKEGPFTGSYAYCDVVHCDLLDPVQVYRTLEDIKPEYLLHLAWDVNNGYQNSAGNIHWMNSSLKLLHYFANTGGRRAVIAGTCFEQDFGVMANGTPLGELVDWMHPKTIYGICKNSLREILENVDFMKSVQLAWGRIFYVYGPHEHLSRLIPTIITGVLRNQIVTIPDHGSNYVDYSYVSDVANGLVTALDSELTGVFHIASEDSVQIRQLAYKICDLTDVPRDMIVFGNDEPEFKEVRGKVTKLASLGWKPQINLDRGLVKTINWWKG